MSVFDPYDLYTKREYRTHKGQIIQKKDILPNFAVTRAEIPRAISILRSFNVNPFAKSFDQVSTAMISYDFSWNTSDYLEIGVQPLNSRQLSLLHGQMELFNPNIFSRPFEDLVSVDVMMMFDGLNIYNLSGTASNISIGLPPDYSYDTTINNIRLAAIMPHSKAEYSIWGVNSSAIQFVSNPDKPAYTFIYSIGAVSWAYQDYPEMLKSFFYALYYGEMMSDLYFDSFNSPLIKLKTTGQDVSYRVSVVPRIFIRVKYKPDYSDTRKEES